MRIAIHIHDVEKQGCRRQPWIVIVKLFAALPKAVSGQILEKFQQTIKHSPSPDAAILISGISSRTPKRLRAECCLLFFSKSERNRAIAARKTTNRQDGPFQTQGGQGVVFRQRLTL
ncbi:hypothetical protein, partial [Brucella abortus]